MKLDKNKDYFLVNMGMSVCETNIKDLDLIKKIVINLMERENIKFYKWDLDLSGIGCWIDCYGFDTENNETDIYTSIKVVKEFWDEEEQEEIWEENIWDFEKALLGEI